MRSEVWQLLLTTCTVVVKLRDRLTHQSI